MENSACVLECCRVIAEALQEGRKVLIMGNGGSAVDVQHFAVELVGRFLLERRALPAIDLTTDMSILTAVCNDYGFDEIFKRQEEALASPGCGTRHFDERQLEQCFPCLDSRQCRRVRNDQSARPGRRQYCWDR